MLQDESVIKDDMEQAANLVREMFYKKYLSKIQKEIDSRQKKIKLNRPKEVELLYALKPFMPQEKSFLVDKMADSIMMAQTITGLQSEVRKEIDSESSIHEDGVYDVDKKCLATKRNNFANILFMAMMCTTL